MKNLHGDVGNGIIQVEKGRATDKRFSPVPVSFTYKKAALAWKTVGGFSYALIATMMIATRNTNDMKS